MSIRKYMDDSITITSNDTYICGQCEHEIKAPDTIYFLLDFMDYLNVESDESIESKKNRLELESMNFFCSRDCVLKWLDLEDRLINFHIKAKSISKFDLTLMEVFLKSEKQIKK